MSSLRQRAIRLLARREHTRAELAIKLCSFAPSNEVYRVLDELASAGFQSDIRFVESYLRTKGYRFGAIKLRQDLRAKGVNEELIECYAAELPPEIERVRSVWRKKFEVAPTNRKEWFRQARFLQSRGFSEQLIRTVLAEVLS